MNPVAFTIFGLDIGWYGIIIATGMLLGAAVATKRAKEEGLPEDIIIDLCLFAVPSAIIGARLYYVIFNWGYYGNNLSDILKFRQGGLAIHGGIIAGAIVGYFFCRAKELRFWKLADICAPSIILGQAIGRWGNYVNREAYGVPTDLPWAIEIDGVKVHPTFLYESLWNFAVFFLLLHLSKRKKFEGQIFIYYMMLYSVARFLIETLRADSLMVGPFRAAQLVSIATIAAAGVILHFRGRKAAVNKR